MNRFAGHFLTLVLSFVLLAGPGFAAAPAAPKAQTAQTVLWRIAGARGSVVLMGSVHVLPAQASWMTDAVKTAIAHADVFVFEAPTDESTVNAITQMVSMRGHLPPGKTLHALLSQQGRTNLDRVLDSLHMPRESLDGVRPWLASLLIEREIFARAGQTTPGPDMSLSQQVKTDGKEVRYLETAAQQMAILAPEDETLELASFEADLKEFDSFDSAKHEIDQLTNAWQSGNVNAIASIVGEEFKDNPKARAYFLDERTRAWVERIEKMRTEGKNFFVVVGIAHMVGDAGLPALLRARGIAVEGP